MNRIEELEEQIKKLQSEIDAIKGENRPNKRWMPEDGHNYFSIDSEGFIKCDTWHGYIGDENRYKMGNIFKTYEEAEFASERLEVIAELKEFAEPYDTNWEADFDNSHCYLYYDHETNAVDYGYVHTEKSGDLYFKDKWDAKRAIAIVGEERIKKYYLGVKET